ncbi:head-tail adaptor protein [Clostridium tetani]|uniref:Head-tail adaptor protein n=1 Tax=Clostridium tetani TaxID=1513 RepID=A0A4Q0VBM3_CLOTA|nr:hypothetical protein [Clostridium tetani]KGI43509.1 hypothetical protein KY55_06775 [Clostridium tetani]RXI44464.1 hypothetical protein DP126_11355 [Clostridium tetani]RXI46579.1 hypothetical protein DP130_10605 [Clostridium tetani]RXI74253.1 hypothetical protein DP127_02640 [Clostridium tetani]RXI78151.1 hypothetical protein DP128_00960 [Clostridium tetani]
MNKKRFFIVILIFVFMLSSSCGRLQKNSSKNTEENIQKSFDINAAKNVVDLYLNYLIKEDYKSAMKYYSKEMIDKKMDIKTTPLKVKGYNIEDINQVGKGGVFKLKVARINLNEPFATLDECIIKINKEDENYKIVDIKSNTEGEAFIERGNIRIRKKSNADTNLLINLSGIPQYSFPKDDKLAMSKLVIPKKNYGVMTFSYSGSSIAISTYDNNSFACIVKLDESKSVQGQENGGATEDGNQGQQQGQNGKGDMVKEKPLGKEVIELDILINSKIDYMTFSQDEKFILLQYSKDKNKKSIRVYNADSGEIIPFKFEEKFPLDKVQVLFSSFDDKSVNVRVIPVNDKDKSLKNLIGNWQLDLKDYKCKKVQ